MSAVVKRALLGAAGLRANERLVLVAVAAHADADGRNAFPSVDTIAELAGVARRTVQRVLARLVELGHLIIDRSRGRRTNVYALAQPRQDGPATVSPQPATVSIERPTVPPKVTPDVKSLRKILEARSRASGAPSGAPPHPATRGGAALPVARRADQCPRHRGAPAHNCGPCRAEALGGAA
ncbi:helix-turn-helix domain-containing protein [Plantactinospora sp. WMMB782]|uniref:helix-turn-helix domain-containing protein n=1 Tax=Plantactinospora sp. WMMB782 TaxID=3404121 RepID=UPI003B94833E